MKAPIYLTCLIFLAGCTSSSPKKGYHYPAFIAATDSNFYVLPLIDSFDTKDSLIIAFWQIAFQAFGEENLSTAPLPRPVYRFYYEGWQQHPVVIRLEENQLIVKEGNQSHYVEYDPELSQMTETEKQHYRLLERSFPLHEKPFHPASKQSVDSMIAKYPELLSTAYYAKLMKKSYSPLTSPFTYTTKKVALSARQYRDLIAVLDSSGYWQSPIKLPCQNPSTDGHGFVLEANTHEGYNYVNVAGCEADSSRLTAFCQRLVKLAGMDKQIRLIWKWKE